MSRLLDRKPSIVGLYIMQFFRLTSVLVYVFIVNMPDLYELYIVINKTNTNQSNLKHLYRNMHTTNC